jgi:hypothetical protein
MMQRKIVALYVMMIVSITKKILAVLENIVNLESGLVFLMMMKKNVLFSQMIVKISVTLHVLHIMFQKLKKILKLIITTMFV